MNDAKIAAMKKVLKPVSPERMAEIARMNASGNGFEQLTLRDAGVEQEVQRYLAEVPAPRLGH